MTCEWKKKAWPFPFLYLQDRSIKAESRHWGIMKKIIRWYDKCGAEIWNLNKTSFQRFYLLLSGQHCMSKLNKEMKRLRVLLHTATNMIWECMRERQILGNGGMKSIRRHVVEVRVTGKCRRWRLDFVLKMWHIGQEERWILVWEKHCSFSPLPIRQLCNLIFDGKVRPY